MSHYFESGMFTKTPAWHNLGIVVDEAPTIEAAIKEIFGQKTAADVIAQWADINDKIKNRVEVLVEDDPKTGPAWGVEVYTVQLVDNDLGKTVNSAIRDIAAKAYQAQAVVITSEGKRQETINLAQGEGQRIKNK